MKQHVTPLERILTQVKTAFAKSPPSGFLLQWDRSRFFQELAQAFPEYKVTNHTDFNYSFCNSYEIEPPPIISNRVHVVTLKMSFIADAFSLHVTEYTVDRRRGRVVSEQTCQAAIDIARAFARERRFVEIARKDDGLRIDGVSLELSEVATLGKCLFDDFE